MGKQIEKKKSNNTAVCIICGILTAFGIVSSIYALATGSKGIWTVNNMSDILVCVLIGYYAFSGYRKPHGNLFKYIMMVFAVTRIMAVYQFARLSLPWLAVNEAIMIGLCCYIAGRLHRVKQNIILMSIIVILSFIGMVIDLLGGIWPIGAFTPIVIWIDIFVAYVLRYKEHKEAGLMDAPTK